MNIASKLKTPTSIFNVVDPPTSDFPGSVDRYGNFEPDFEEISAFALILPVTVSAIIPETTEPIADLSNATFTGYYAQNVDINARSRVEWTDRFGVSHVAQVRGQPARLEDAHARPVLIQVALVESEFLGG